MSTKQFTQNTLNVLSKIGDFKVRPMMGEYLIYYKDKLVGDICDNRILIKRTPTSDSLLGNMPLDYPYEGSKQLMYVLNDLENTEMLGELFSGMYKELPEKKNGNKKSK